MIEHAAGGSWRRCAAIVFRGRWLSASALCGITRACQPRSSRRQQAAKTAPEGGPACAAPVKSLVETSGRSPVADRLQAAWPDPPESVAMLVDILKGSQLGPGDGWFKKAVAQTRYGWTDARCKRLDRDGDGRIGRRSSPAAMPTSPGSTATTTELLERALTSTSRRTR